MMTAQTCEYKLINKFEVLRKNFKYGLYSEYGKLSYGGMIQAEAIASKGGLYDAIVVVLVMFYNRMERIQKIDKFIEQLSSIKCMTLEEIGEEKVEEIMNKFDEITS